MYILGGLGDQITLLVWSMSSDGFFSLPVEILSYKIYREMFSWFLNPRLSASPPLEFITSLLLTSFGAQGVTVLFILSALVIFLATYLLLRKYKFGFLLSVVYTFSSFFWGHLGIHLSLLQLWMFPLFIYLYEKYLPEAPVKKASLILGGFLALSLIFSNYLGAYLFMFYGVYTVLYSLFGKFQWVPTKRRLKVFIYAVLFAVLISAPIFFPYLKINFGQKPIEEISAFDVVRPFEDFIYFSGRPWYLGIPSPKNPWLGEISKTALQRISDTNYFLADDYSFVEHSSFYFGVSFWLLTLTSGVLVIKLKPELETKKKLFALYGTALILFLFTFPPYFTISGATFWTPGYLMYRFLPVFRATSRLTSVIHFCLVLALGVSFNVVFEKGSKKLIKILRFFVPLLLLFTLLETYVPPKIQWIEPPSEAFSYLNSSTPKNSRFIVYPYTKSIETFLWLNEHKRHLVNIRDYKNSQYSSFDLTEQLLFPDGIKHARQLDTSYLVLFKEASEEDKEFFLSSLELELLTEFEDAYVFEVR